MIPQLHCSALIRSALRAMALLASATTLFAADSIVDWNATRQTIDGFGAATGGASEAQSEDLRKHSKATEIMDLLYNTQTGAGLSILRLNIDPEIVDNNGNYNWNKTTVTGHKWIAEQAIARGADKVWAAQWSPPAIWKNNNSLINGSLLSENYQKYADFQAAYCAKFINDFGIPIYAVGPQNEPGGKPWASCIWSPEQLNTYTRDNLAPTLASVAPSVLVMSPESTNWYETARYMDVISSDPVTNGMVDIVAGHNYNSNPVNNLMSTKYGRTNWQSEWCYEGTDNTTISNGLDWAYNIWNFMNVAEVNAFHYWRLVNFWDNGKEEGLINTTAKSRNYTVAKRLWTIGNYSRFVRPGWVRLASVNPIPQDKVYLSAFRHPSNGSFALVYVNRNSSSRSVTLDLSNFATTSLTPYRTSDTEDLVALSAISVSGPTVTLNLAANSVTTYTGTSTGQGVAIPVANAGTDFLIYDTDNTGAETITLDGSASLNGANAASYVWTEGATTLATGATPTISLPVGVHTLTLTVTAANATTSTDTVIVTVKATGNTLLESNFTGVALATELPWTPTYYKSPAITTTGWSKGTGLNAQYRDNGIFNSQSHPSSIASDSTLAIAIEDNEYLSLSITPATGNLNLRAATVAFTINSDGYQSAKRYAVLTNIGGFTDGAQVYTNPSELTTYDTDVTYTFTLPDTAAYENLSSPVEFRIYGYVGQYGFKVWGLTGWSLTTTASASSLVAFNSATAAIAESNTGTANASLSVTRTGSTTGAISVAYATADGTANAGTDYTATTGTLNWADGDTFPKTILIPIAGDTTYELDESFTVTLSGPTGGAILGPPSIATITITNDDAGPGALAFENPIATVSETAGTATLNVTRSDSAGAVSVSYATANGTATAGTDYTATTGTLTWADGDSAPKTILIPITDDNTLESPETFTVTLSAPTGGATLGTTAQTPVSILDDESADIPPSVTITTPATTVSNHPDLTQPLNLQATVTDTEGPPTLTWSVISAPNGGSATFSPNNTANTSVTFTTPGTYLLRLTAQGHYYATNREVQITAGLGNTTNYLYNADFEIDPDQSQTITGWSLYTSTDSGNADYVDATDTHQNGAKHLTHTNPGVNAWDVYTYQVVTGLANGNYRLTAWARKSGSGYTSAQLYAEFYSTPYAALTADIPTSSTYQLVDIRNIPVSDGQCTIGLWTDVNAASGNPTVHFDQLDFHLESSGTLALTDATLSIPEGNTGTTQLTLTVNRTSGSDNAVSVNYATANGTATAGTDYTATTGTLNWADRDYTPKTITIPIPGDTIGEPDETFTVTLSSPTGAATLGTTTVATITITNDDTPYSSWTNSINWNGADSAPTAIVSPLGVPNLMLYALDIDSPFAADTSKLPTIATDSTTPSGPWLTYTYRENQAASDLTYVIQSDDDLSPPWTDLVIDNIDVFDDIADADPDGDSSSRLIRVRVKFDSNTEPAQFLRLRVNQ